MSLFFIFFTRINHINMPGKQLARNRLRANKGQLRENEFLCVGCKGRTRVTYAKRHVCAQKMPNGAYLIKAHINCSNCVQARRVAKFISAADFAKSGIQRCVKGGCGVCGH